MTSMASTTADLPPMGMQEILPVVGMVLAILVILLYGLGCLGGGSAPEKGARRKAGSGSSGRPRPPEGYSDDDSDSDEDDKDK
eukprot:CAMPEP_0173426430 /NCGR_PEP_ID=MMETSP1357-20121228/5895_1 /TAXON_ID=77926 /ORGANISM="Hemiselmis rufescens, Strain PCC563" /LENGTH=82 /DNA_ID=CAMNT_0014390091 /DNA_START=20 /DNA_END=268 /DNA_ORIENTATION=+